LIQFEIIEADAVITSKVAEIERLSSRHNDLVAALYFKLARDPRSYSTRVPGLVNEVYADWTVDNVRDLPRLLVWYVIEDTKVVIHDMVLVDNGST